MTVFESERDAARLSGRCMGCGERTKYLPTSERYVALCLHPECRRYYMALRHESVVKPERAVVRQARRVVKAIINPSPNPKETTP